ncbi:hypothetical protein GCM10009799_41270 [Nocardiopsis rhodophaea]|uniref:Flavin reductase like domain-containing protein n=2 Tax=Nocardiopsis rhodophaea TaxID=280238 RepID=A0ABP5EX00_9ACTN
MANVCAPVTVVTAMHDEIPHGATVSSFTSVSLRPPIVSIALDRRSNLLDKIQRTHWFGVNVLSSGQEDIARAFSTSRADRFHRAPWRQDQGLPRLACAVSWAVCRVHRVVPGGDHLLLLGLALHAESTTAAPLIYGNRTFGTHSAFVRGTRAITDQIAAFTH